MSAQRITRLPIRFGAVATACLLALVACEPEQIAFREVAALRLLDSIDQRPSAVAYRQRFMELKPGVFQTLAGGEPLSKPVLFNLFPDTSYPIVFDRFEDGCYVPKDRVQN